MRHFFALDTALKKRWLRYFWFFRGVSLLPEGIAYRLATYMGSRDFRQKQEWSQVLASGLRLALPDAPESVINECVKANFQMIARDILDVFRFSCMDVSDLGRIIRPLGFDVLKRAQEGGKGVIIIMSHYGRPTMLSTALGLSGFKVGMLTQQIDITNAAINPVDREYLEYKMRVTMERAGGHWVTTKNLRSLYSLLKQGEIIIIMQDVAPSDEESGLRVPFLKGTLHIPKGILRLAQQTDANLVYGVAKEQGTIIRAELRELPKDKHSAMLAAVQEFERDVQEQPCQWWQWYHFAQVWSPAERNGNNK